MATAPELDLSGPGVFESTVRAEAIFVPLFGELSSGYCEAGRTISGTNPRVPTED